MKSRPASGGGQSVFWLEIPWLPDKFQREYWVGGPGRSGTVTMLDGDWVVEPPRRGIIRGVMSLFVPDLTWESGGAIGRLGSSPQPPTSPFLAVRPSTTSPHARAAFTS